jgi:hypothetical protein
MENIKNIPDEILNLVQNQSYDQLDESELGIVNQFLSLEEYTDLHNAYIHSKAFFIQDESMEPSVQIKENLLKSFREKNKKRVEVKMNPFLIRVSLWKVAAVFIGLFGLSYFVIIKNIKGSTEILYTSIHDTIRVPVLIPEQSIPVSSVKEVLHKKLENNKRTSNHKPINNSSGRNLNSNNQPKVDSGIRSLDPGDLKQGIKPKGKTMKEDPLVNRFSFARI